MFKLNRTVYFISMAIVLSAALLINGCGGMMGGSDNSYNQKMHKNHHDSGSEDVNK